MKKILLGLGFSVLFLGCSKDKSQCSYDACALSAPAAEVTALESYLTTNSIIATKHCSGYYFIIDAAGSGAAPNICSGVSVKYKGALLSGVIFDQTTTAVVNFNLNSLIEAWKKCIMQVKPGGKIRIWAPPSLCYGANPVRDNTGSIVIPANSTLYFEIELVAVL